MNEPSKAAFSFENFKIVSFSLSEPTENHESISITINPTGKYYTGNGVFEQTIDFVSFEEGDFKKIIAEAKIIAVFTFENPISFSEIPNFFYLNSIAIVFPYIRAFISSLTLQANIKPLILPVLNLTGLDKPLKENTIVLEENYSL